MSALTQQWERRDEEAEALNRALTTISRWVDDGQPEDRSPEALTWHRTAKVSEEAGEVVEAMIGWTGGNPRKGQVGGWGKVETELLDTAVAALAAVEHLRRTQDDSAPDLLTLLVAHALEKQEAISRCDRSHPEHGDWRCTRAPHGDDTQHGYAGVFWGPGARL